MLIQKMINPLSKERKLEIIELKDFKVPYKAKGTPPFSKKQGEFS